MTELLQVEVWWGEAGDTIPISEFENSHWQSPNYEESFPEGEKEPELVDHFGNPVYKNLYTTIESMSGELYGYHATPSKNVLTWDTITEKDREHYYLHAKLKEPWFGIKVLESPGNNFGIEPSGFLYYEIYEHGGSELFDESYGILHDWEAEIVKIAKKLAEEEAEAYVNRYANNYRSVEKPKINFARILLVCEIKFESNRDWETGVEEGYPIITDLGTLDLLNSVKVNG